LTETDTDARPETVAERNARILASRIPPSRRWQLDTSPAAVCLTTQTPYGEQRQRIEDQTPAAALGVTVLQASAAYNRPVREVRRVFAWAKGSDSAPIGRLDHWMVWWAERADLEAVFGEDAGKRSGQATDPHWRTRAAERAERRAGKLRTYRQGEP
jgi:hypothetical protein